MILVKGKAGKGEGGKEVFPFFSLPLSDPPPASSAHSDQRMRGSENQQFGNNCRPKRLSPSSPPLPLSLFVALFMHLPAPLLLRDGVRRERQNGAASEQACGPAAGRGRCSRSQEDFLLHYTPRSEEGERRMGWSAHYVAAGSREGGRERMRREEEVDGGEQASCGETKITPLSELEHQSVYLAFHSACLPRFPSLAHDLLSNV